MCNDINHEIADNLGLIANAILPYGTTPGHDAAGGTVVSLTEAIMGVTAGLMAIARALDKLADNQYQPGYQAALEGVADAINNLAYKIKTKE